MPFDPSSAQIFNSQPSGPVSTGFDPSSAKIYAPEPQQDVPISTGADQSANLPSAVVAGLSNAGANLFEGGVDAVTWLGEKLGAIDPEVASQMKKDVHADMEKYFRSSEETPAGDVFNESRMKYPAAAAIPQAVTEVGMLSKLNPSIQVPGKVANVAANVGLQSGVGALAAAGLAGPNTSSQDGAALLGAIIPPALAGVGAGLKAGATSLANKYGLGKYVDDLVGTTNKDLLSNNQLTTTEKAAASIDNLATKVKQIENENYNTIKQIPGTIRISPIQETTRNLISANPRMPENQLAILEDVSRQAGAMRTMDDALKLKIALSDQYKTFGKGAASDSVYKGFQALRQQVDASIGAKADAAGLVGDWTAANKYHTKVVRPLQDSDAFAISKAFQNRADNPQEYEMAVKGLLTRAQKSPESMKTVLNMMGSDGSKIIEQDMVKKVFGDAVGDVSALNQTAALRKLNTFINKFDGSMSKTSIESLKGAKKMLENAGATLSTKPIPSATSNLGPNIIGASLGGLAGVPFGGVGSIVGAGVGATVLPKLVSGISSLLSTPQGQAVLQGISKNRPWAKKVGEVIKASLLEAAGKTLKSPGESK